MVIASATNTRGSIWGVAPPAVVWISIPHGMVSWTPILLKNVQLTSDFSADNYAWFFNYNWYWYHWKWDDDGSHSFKRSLAERDADPITFDSSEGEVSEADLDMSQDTVPINVHVEGKDEHGLRRLRGFRQWLQAAFYCAQFRLYIIVSQKVTMFRQEKHELTIYVPVLSAIFPKVMPSTLHVRANVAENRLRCTTPDARDSQNLYPILPLVASPMVLNLSETILFSAWLVILLNEWKTYQ